MRAILNNDIIVTLIMGDTKGTEIGDLPKNVGLERLRFNGSEVVDLAELSAFWVETIAGGFMLHAVQVPNSNYIEMAFSDRQYLYINGGAPSVKTPEQIAIEEQAKQILVLKNALRLKLRDTVGDIQDQHMISLAFICAIIVYARQQPQVLADFFDDLIPHIIDIFPLSRWEDILKTGAKDIKTAMQDYYDGVDQI